MLCLDAVQVVSEHADVQVAVYNLGCDDSISVTRRASLWTWARSIVWDGRRSRRRRIVKRRCVFMDRDGVINAAPPQGEYLRSWREFRFLPGVADWIRLFNALDLLVVVVTNQQGVAKGLTRMEDLDEIHRNMVSELRQLGAFIDDIYCCPHKDNTCECRKPRPGMVRSATEKWDIDLGRSLMIGDSETDRQLAVNCGLRFVHVQNGIIQSVNG